MSTIHVSFLLYVDTECSEQSQKQDSVFASVGCVGHCVLSCTRMHACDSSFSENNPTMQSYCSSIDNLMEAYM